MKGPRRAALIAAVVASLAEPVHAGRPQAQELVAEGDALAAAGDRDGALARYRAAVVEDPDLIVAYDHAVPLWFATQRWDEAGRYLERATVRHPEWPGGWYALGFVYRKTNRADAAVAAYQEYAALRPGEAAPWYGLAASFEMAGDVTNAVRAWRRYRALERDADRALYRAEAERAIDRLLGPPHGWRDAMRRWMTDGGGAAAARRVTVAFPE